MVDPANDPDRGRLQTAELLCDGMYDQPSTVDDQVRWLAAAGFNAAVVWTRQDLCVIVADPRSYAAAWRRSMVCSTPRRLSR